MRRGTSEFSNFIVVKGKNAWPYAWRRGTRSRGAGASPPLKSVYSGHFFSTTLCVCDLSCSQFYLSVFDTMNSFKQSLEGVVSKLFNKSASNGALDRGNFILNGLVVVGAFTTISLATSFCSFTWKYFLRPFPKLKCLYGGSWAIVTGGSAGIGLEIARNLVENGINVVLIARGAKDLTSAARELSLLNPEVDVRIVTCDAAAPDLPSLMKSLQDIESFSMLFNNVGVHNDIPTNTEDMSADEVNRIISVNCNFQVQFTSLLIPKLLVTETTDDYQLHKQQHLQQKIKEDEIKAI